MCVQCAALKTLPFFFLLCNEIYTTRVFVIWEAWAVDMWVCFYFDDKIMKHIRVSFCCCCCLPFSGIERFFQWWYLQNSSFTYCIWRNVLMCILSCEIHSKKKNSWWRLQNCTKVNYTTFTGDILVDNSHSSRNFSIRFIAMEKFFLSFFSPRNRHRVKYLKKK